MSIRQLARRNHEARSTEYFVNSGNLAFRATIAPYPGCGVIGGRPSIPTLILVGELDDWTPANDCARATLGKRGSAGRARHLSWRSPCLRCSNLPPRGNDVWPLDG